MTLLLGVFAGMVLGVLLERKRKRAFPGARRGAPTVPAAAAATETKPSGGDKAPPANTPSAERQPLGSWLTSLRGLVKRPASTASEAPSTPARPRTMAEMKAKAAIASGLVPDSADTFDDPMQTPAKPSGSATLALPDGMVKFSQDDWGALDTLGSSSSGGGGGKRGNSKARRTNQKTDLDAAFWKQAPAALPAPPKASPPAEVKAEKAFGELWSELKPQRPPYAPRHPAPKPSLHLHLLLMPRVFSLAPPPLEAACPLISHRVCVQAG